MIGRRLHRGLAAGLGGLAVGTAATIWALGDHALPHRAAAFDAALALAPDLAPPPGTAPVRVVDFGAVDEGGAPWGRAAMARLVERLHAGSAAVVALDVLFSAPCDGGADTAALARALARGPTVLGVLPADLPAAQGPIPAPLAMAARNAPALWSAPGVEAPCPALTAAAAGHGGMALFADPDGQLRHLPAAMALQGTPVLPLGIEAALQALEPEGAALAVLEKGALRLGPAAALPLDAMGGLWLFPARPEAMAARTLRAEAVLAAATPPDLTGAVVIVGSSLPERGGMRATFRDALTPSVQVQADLALAALKGHAPHRPSWAGMAEGAGALILSLAGLAVMLRAGVLAGAGALIAGGALWLGGALALTRHSLALVDPVLTPAALAALVALALPLHLAQRSRAERRFRGHLVQLLPEPVVARLADDPARFRLAGEERVVTALFTDLEGFSTATNRLPPAALVAALDAHFSATTAIVLRHGGMIDKIVGDSLHALFNLPLDDPGHVDAALACAEEIARVTAAQRAGDGPASALGRVRIGIETGTAIVGGIGSGPRVDFTAHGPAVNLAARLQEMNKTLGTTVCVGPGAAAAATRPLHPLGRHEVRSFGALALYSPDAPRAAEDGAAL